VTANNTAGAASASPTLCANTALASITHATTGATGIGTATGLPPESPPTGRQTPSQLVVHQRPVAITTTPFR
jgi:hypothetical protein